MKVQMPFRVAGARQMCKVLRRVACKEWDVAHQKVAKSARRGAEGARERLKPKKCRRGRLEAFEARLVPNSLSDSKKNKSKGAR